MTALTPYCMAASRRLGGWAAAPLAAVIAVMDFLRYGPFADSIPYWVTLISLIPGWMFGYQLGVSWGEKRLGRRGAWLLFAGGTALFALLLLVFHYPASLVGVPGQDRTNSHPPSLLVIALAAAQSGAAILLRDRIADLLRRPALWAPVTAVNRSAMTILCWHQTAMLAIAVPASFVGATVQGLTTAPDFPAWMAPACRGCRSSPSRSCSSPGWRDGWRRRGLGCRGGGGCARGRWRWGSRRSRCG
ncbi:hypothetical protein SRIMM317S_06574 [Streptomyces rimosus subsp. rimosus]